MKVFCSGSCRLLSTIRKTKEIEPIHSLEEPHFKGINFLGKFHNTKLHIQFIQFIKGEIKLFSENVKKIFTVYNNEKWEHIRYFEPKNTIFSKIYNLQKEIDNCDVYIFEICSIKIYKYNGAYCQFEQNPNNDVSEYDFYIQTEKELYDDLCVLQSFFPGKKIIFQCHFRPNVIYKDETQTIEARELIYNILQKFCKEYNNCFLYDPSILLQNNNLLLLNDTHYNNDGYNASFDYLYNNYLKN